jgi:hypothetical protein
MKTCFVCKEDYIVENLYLELCNVCLESPEYNTCEFREIFDKEFKKQLAHNRNPLAKEEYKVR